MQTSSALSRFFRDPLAHFLVAGAALFGLYALVSDEPEVRENQIIVDAAQITRLTDQFERTWLRPPSADELGHLIEEHVREEILYREALAMGLDDDDLVVRRRMRQKLEFMFDDLSVARAPTDAELRAYLDEHAEMFRRPPRMSFHQVYLNADARGAAVTADAEALLNRLREDAALDPGALGDPTLLPSGMTAASVDEIARVFGKELAEQMAELPAGAWTAPVASTYGLHLVRIDQREPGRMPSLDEVRAEVVREWESQQRRKANDAFYAALRGRYEVLVGAGPTPQSMPAGGGGRE
jgi:hypothetical protein